MADDRRIIFNSYALVQESAASEESIESKWIVYPGIGSSVGGKSTVTDLNATQWSDNWCSVKHNEMNWEDYADATDNSGNRWEDVFFGWGDILSISTSAHQLTQGVSTATDVDVAFLYIKNLGTVELTVSLNGTSGEYDLLIPAGAGISLRGGDASFHCDDIHVKTASGTTTIQYVLAIK